VRGLFSHCIRQDRVCIRTIPSRMTRRVSTTVTEQISSPSSPSFPSPNPIPFVDTHPKPVLRTAKDDSPRPLAPLLNTSNIYMTVHINSFPYLLSPNDTLRLPFHLPDAPLGSILRMTHVSRIGSRDYTLQGHPFIDPKVFTVKLRVIEHTKQPMVVTIKTKQRQRRARHLPNKQNYTVLK